MKQVLIITSLLLMLVAACTDNSITTPKPPLYLRLELPEHTYATYDSTCPYSFRFPPMYLIKDVYDSLGATCHKDINLGPLNGQIHFSYIEMSEPLARYVNYANDKVGDHKIKATGIDDVQIIRPKDRVFGTFFKLKGDVAAPFHFYLTDSTSRFVSGVVYFNSVPNYDSLKPTLDYLAQDIDTLLHSFQWKN